MPRPRPPLPAATRVALAGALAVTSALAGAPRAGAQPAAAPRDTVTRDTVVADTTARAAPGEPGGEYATPALRAFVARASRGNELPPGLVAYRAAIETEIAVIARRDEGTEGVVGLEQASSVLRWTRTGYYDQHVVGYRAQQAGLGVSLVGMFRGGWATPTLYGNRFRLRSTPRDSTRERRRSPRDSARAARRAGAARTDTLAVVHPLAADRDRWYRYRGGDTVVTLRAGGRELPIVRVLVEPRAELPGRAGLFRGELDLDATRAHVVRMRGHLVAPPERGARARLQRALAQGYAYIEYVNAERGGAYWLPSYQRVELQATGTFLGEARGIVRIVSRFGDLAVNDTTVAAAEVAAADSLRARARRRLTFASADSLQRFDAWQRAIGSATAEVHGDDFADLAPETWRTVGPPRLEWVAQRGSDLLRYNRVEGLWTGAGARLRLRDAAPGLTVRANAGWAWSERTARGRVSVERWLPADTGRQTAALAGEGWLLGARLGRTLDITNDLRNPFDSGSTLGALFGADEYDYVDRRLATLQATRVLGRRLALARLELGVASDRYAPAARRRGPLGGDDFRPNRGVDEGRYARTALALDLRPDVNAEFVRPGVGAQLLYERGDGDLDWQRVDARVVARRSRPLGRGALTLVARADGGLLAGPDRPPQQLYELGSTQSLPGYGYKEFVGDRVALGRAMLMWTSPYLRGPLMLRRPVRVALPGINPGLSVGVQSGWTSLSNDAARAAAARLQPAGAPALDPVPRETDGARTSINAGLRLFGGAVFVGAARALERGGRWRGVLSLGRQL